MRAKRAGECDGPAGLPEAARGGPGPTPWSPARVVHPGARHPCGSSPTRDRKGGRRRRAPEPAPPPTRRPPDGPRAPSASPTRAREHPRTAAGAGEGPPALPPAGRRVTSAPPTPSESPSHRAARSAERRGHYLLRRGGGRTAAAGGSATPEGPPGRGARQGEEHARPLAQGQRVDSSTGRVTTNRSTPPAHPARLAAAHPDRINPHL